MTIIFDKILSTETHYGCIWYGTYIKKMNQPKTCIIKMVLIDSPHANPNAFISNDEKPYYHKLFQGRKSMSTLAFEHEVNMIKTLSKTRLAPKLYTSYIETTKYKTTYGFIVMEKMDKTVKDVLLKRDLSSKETNKILENIDLLHKLDVCHGDCKPSNIGVKLKNGEINKIRFLDLAKCRKISSNKDVDRDIKTFWQHLKSNTNLRL